ncbi:DUF1768-domain-containing protein, partial [Mycena leptocephala]
RILFYPGQKDQYHSFTNRSPHRITYNGKKYPTAEHLYQAFRYMDNRPDIAEGVRTISKSGTKAHKHSRAHVAEQHPDWDMMRTAKMEITLWHKFSQNTQLKRLLLGTGNAELVNYTTKDFWGVGKDQKGRNELGKALERVRSGLREI